MDAGPAATYAATAFAVDEAAASSADAAAITEDAAIIAEDADPVFGKPTLSSVRVFEDIYFGRLAFVATISKQLLIAIAVGAEHPSFEFVRVIFARVTRQVSFLIGL